jgi:hypothetical protein
MAFTAFGKTLAYFLIQAIDQKVRNGKQTEVTQRFQ